MVEVIRYRDEDCASHQIRCVGGVCGDLVGSVHRVTCANLRYFELFFLNNLTIYGRFYTDCKVIQDQLEP